MSEQAEHQVVVSADGRIRFIWDDQLAGLLELGAAEVRRASHVDPAHCSCGQTTSVLGWTADLWPVGGPVLGPFALHAEALAAERQWIKQNVL